MQGLGAEHLTGSVCPISLLLFLLLNPLPALVLQVPEADSETDVDASCLVTAGGWFLCLFSCHLAPGRPHLLWATFAFRALTVQRCTVSSWEQSWVTAVRRLCRVRGPHIFPSQHRAVSSTEPCRQLPGSPPLRESTTQVLHHRGTSAEPSRLLPSLLFIELSYGRCMYPEDLWARTGFLTCTCSNRPLLWILLKKVTCTFSDLSRVPSSY